MKNALLTWKFSLSIFEKYQPQMRPVSAIPLIYQMEAVRKMSMHLFRYSIHCIRSYLMNSLKAPHLLENIVRIYSDKTYEKQNVNPVYYLRDCHYENYHLTSLLLKENEAGAKDSRKNRSSEKKREKIVLELIHEKGEKKFSGERKGGGTRNNTGVNGSERKKKGIVSSVNYYRDYDWQTRSNRDEPSAARVADFKKSNRLFTLIQSIVSPSVPEISHSVSLNTFHSTYGNFPYRMVILQTVSMLEKLSGYSPPALGVLRPGQIMSYAVRRGDGFLPDNTAHPLPEPVAHISRRVVDSPDRTDVRIKSGLLEGMRENSARTLYTMMGIRRFPGRSVSISSPDILRYYSSRDVSVFSGREKKNWNETALMRLGAAGMHKYLWLPDHNSSQRDIGIGGQQPNGGIPLPVRPMSSRILKIIHRCYPAERSNGSQGSVKTDTTTASETDIIKNSVVSLHQDFYQTMHLKRTGAIEPLLVEKDVAMGTYLVRKRPKATELMPYKKTSRSVQEPDLSHIQQPIAPRLKNSVVRLQRNSHQVMYSKRTGAVEPLPVEKGGAISTYTVGKRPDTVDLMLNRKASWRVQVPDLLHVQQPIATNDISMDRSRQAGIFPVSVKELSISNTKRTNEITVAPGKPLGNGELRRIAEKIYDLLEQRIEREKEWKG